MQSFLGLLSYYRKFCYMLAEGTRRLRILTKRKKQKQTLTWTKATEEELKRAKTKLADRALLHPPDFEKPFWIRCDASNHAIGATLMQKNNSEQVAIEFFSRRLTDAEVNYGVSEKEVLAMVCALERWHAYVHGTEVLVTTDHKPLLAFDTTNKQRLMRWRLRLAPYNIKQATLEQLQR